MEDIGGRKFILVMMAGALCFLTVWVCTAFNVSPEQFKKVETLFDVIKWLVGLYLGANIGKSAVDQIRK